MEAARHLHLIDPESGEVFPQKECPGCAEREILVQKLERRIRGLDLQIDNLKRDHDAEVRASGLWPVGVRLFGIWRGATGQKRCKFSAVRFDLVEPFLDGFDRRRHQSISTEVGPPTHPLEQCAAAIIGRVTDHFVTRRSNGTPKHFWEWERIFASRGEWEESMARRPRNWREVAISHDPGERK